MTYLFSGYRLHAFLRWVTVRPKQNYRLTYHHGLGAYECRITNIDSAIEGHIGDPPFLYTTKYCFVDANL